MRLSTMQFIDRFGTVKQREEARKKGFSTDSGTKLLETCMDIVENNNLGDKIIEVIIPPQDYKGVTLLIE